MMSVFKRQTLTWTAWGCFLSWWNCLNSTVLWHDIDLWQQHIFVRAKLSWKCILNWGEKRCCFIFMQRELSETVIRNSSSFFNFKKCDVLETKLFFYIDFGSWCFECWMRHPSRWARHSEWNVVVKGTIERIFAFFVADDMQGDS